MFEVFYRTTEYENILIPKEPTNGHNFFDKRFILLAKHQVDRDKILLDRHKIYKYEPTGKTIDKYGNILPVVEVIRSIYENTFLVIPDVGTVYVFRYEYNDKTGRYKKIKLHITPKNKDEMYNKIIQEFNMNKHVKNRLIHQIDEYL